MSDHEQFETNTEGQIVHKHLVVRSEVNNPLVDPELTKTWLTDLVNKIGMKIVSGPHVAFVTKPGNVGITGAVIIETSHCTVHVWSENTPSLMQLDVYSCSKFDKQTVFDHFQQFEPVSLEYTFTDRGPGLKLMEASVLL